MLNKLLIGLCILALTLTGSVQATTILESTDAIEIVTTSTAGIDYTASWSDITSTTTVGGKSAGAISSATTTTAIAAPAASTVRVIKELTLRNTSTTTSNTVTIQRDVSATNLTMYKRTLGPGESLDMDANGTITPYDATGRMVVASVDASGVNGWVYPIQKAGGAKDAAGYWYSTLKDAGIPGAYVLQAPGLNGFTTDCSIATQTTDPNGAAQMGAHVLTDPASGSLYLKSVAITDSVAEVVQLIDVLWYNTGIVVTTTTNQAITTPTLPARDLNGSNNGDGINAAIYAVAALGNAATVSNTTLTYTDQDGNASATGTFSAVVGWQAPATPVIGTWMPFQLAAGDRGIRTITAITLGTTYTSGTMSLFLYRVLATIPVPTANVVTQVDFGNPGVKIHPNSCIVALQVGSASAGNLSGSYTVVER